MKIKELAYLCIKNSVMLDDNGFTLESFDRDNDIFHSLDYANSANNVMAPINEAIARLSDLERIPYKTLETELPSGELTVDGSKEIVNVGTARDYEKVNWRAKGSNSFVLLERVDGKIVVEYKEDIPYFNDMFSTKELKTYGITDSMCNYIIEYCQGKLMETLEPTIAMSHTTRAEQYFSNIRPVKSCIRQTRVKKRYSAGI